MDDRKPKKKAEKVILIRGADKSVLGEDSVITDKPEELAWKKKRPKPGA